MTRRALAAASIALLLSSCDLVHHVVTLTFDDAATTVTIATTTELGTADEGTREASILADLRNALLAGRDEWSIRFANSDPERERVTFERERGSLRAVDHSAKIAVGNLQKFFFDTPLTVTTTRGEGWAELNIYPGSSLRATRQQRLNAEKKLGEFSGLAQRYFGRVATLYRYFEERPQRAEPVLTWVFASDKETNKPAISDDEESLVEAVRDAIDKLASADPEGTLNSDLDAVYNPFPAELHVIVPGETLTVEGFSRSTDGGLIVKTVDAVEAVGMLEGRWISPDPIAAIVANGKKSGAEIAAAVAPLPRKIGVVVGPAEISDALIEKMRPAPRYRVRWIIKPNAKSISDKPEARN